MRKSKDTSILRVMPDGARIARWRMRTRSLRAASGGEQFRTLREFGDSVRSLAAMATRASPVPRNIDASLDLVEALSVVVGGWLSADPYNPDWPGRDRLFIGRKQSLLAACAALASAGFFSPENVTRLADEKEKGYAAFIPGLESADADMPASAWRSAVASGQDKQAWRHVFETDAGAGWVDPNWAKNPYLWRTCLIIDSEGREAEACLGLPSSEGGAPRGISVLVATPWDVTDEHEERWRLAGWNTAILDRSDYLSLYTRLTASPGDEPAAILLSMAASSNRAKESAQTSLIGNLSDEQFNTMFNQTLRW